MLFWHSVYGQKIKNAQAMQLSTLRLLTKMTSGILRFLHLAQYMTWCDLCDAYRGYVTENILFR